MLPIKVDEDGNVHTPSNAVIVNGVETKGIQVKDIEAHLDYEWEAEDWNTDFNSLPVNSKKLGLKLREDTLSSNGDFSINTEDWKIPKDSYIDLNMRAKLPPQEIATRSSQVSDGAVLSFLLDWSGDDTTTGPKWNGGNEEENPDNPSTGESNIKGSSTDTIVVGETGNVMFNWDTKGDTILIDSIISSNEEVATIGSITGEEGNKIVQINGLKAGKTTITAKLNNKEIASFEVEVYQVDENKEIQIEVADKEFSVGNKLSSSDVTVKVPLLTSDGSNKYIEVVPSIEDTALKVGDNSLTGTITIGENTYNITIEITINNPSNDLTMSVEEAQAMGFSFENCGNGLRLIGFENKQYKANINIPEQIGDFKVTHIGENVFKDQTNIRSVNIPDTIVLIDNNAFRGCSSLESFDTNKVVTIADNVFYGCNRLSEVELREGLNSLGADVFYNCDIREIEIPNSLTVASGTFNSNLVRGMKLKLKEGRTSFWNCAFLGYDNIQFPLDNIELPSTLISLGNYTFKDSKISGIEIPDQIIEIGTGTFQNCKSLCNIVLSKNLEVIGSSAFQNAGRRILSTIVFPDGLKEIGDYAFYSMYNNYSYYSDITLPNTIKRIGNSAFSGNSAINNLEIKEGVSDCIIGNSAFSPYANQVSTGGPLSVILPDGIVELGSSCFAGCNFESIHLPDSIEKIGIRCFYDCKKLTELILPSQIKDIPNRMCEGCEKLSTLVIPNSVLTIGEYAFNKCNILKEINIDKEENSIEGSPWDAPKGKSIVNWLR